MEDALAKEGQIVQEVTRQGNLAKELLEVVDKLEIRLADVTRENTPLPETATEDKSPVVLLARRIEENNEGVLRCIHRLISLTERIEV